MIFNTIPFGICDKDIHKCFSIKLYQDYIKSGSKDGHHIDYTKNQIDIFSQYHISIYKNRLYQLLTQYTLLHWWC